MKIKDMERAELAKLIVDNKWLDEQIQEQVWDNLGYVQRDQFELIGADVFGYHDHYDSFYLTTPTEYGAKAPEKVAGKLDRDYLTDEQAELYDKLCKLNDKMEDAEEWDEDRPEYEEMTDVCDKLAESLTYSLRDIMGIDARIEEQDYIIDQILDGENWLSDLEVEDGAIIEVVKHK